MNTLQTFAILFWISKNRIKNGKAPLWVRVTVDGKRVEMSAQREVTVREWDPRAQMATAKTPEGKEINNHLSLIKTKLLSCQSKLEARGEPVTAENLKNQYFGVVEKQRKLVPIFRQHNDDINSLIGNGYSRGTWVKFNTVLNHLEAFLLHKYSVTDISLKSLNLEFFCDFEFYLRSQKKIDLNTTAKYLQSFKKIITACVTKNWIDKHPFAGYKFKMKVLDREFLSENELELLHQKHFITDRLNLVKDIFLFSCYTGLSYIDVLNLTPNNIALGIDGEKWVFTHRQKTETASRIPLLPPALAILGKYSNHPQVINRERLLPILSNQKMNAYLKEISACCGITKDLTFHIARHTFATTVTLSNGIPIETVSKMLGHTRLQTTQHYAKILDKKVSNDMQILFRKYQNTDASQEERKTSESAG